MEYKYTAPKYFKGDNVNCKDHKGSLYIAKVTRVTTNYSKDNISYHVYSIYIEGRKRLLHIGEANIINLIK